MCMWGISHIMISMQKMVNFHLVLLLLISLLFLMNWMEYWKFYQHFAEHFNPLLEQIAKLEEALYNIQFEQHWLEAQTDRQAIGTVLKNQVAFLVFSH